MIRFLRILFLVILIVMIGTTVMTSLKSNLFEELPTMLEHPWTVMTLLDAYFGFITFYVWVFYKERSVGKRLLWFVLIMTLGNIAMALYMLIQLFRLPLDASAQDLLLRRAG